MSLSSSLHSKISKSLLNMRWLNKHGFSKSLMKSHINSPAFRTNINNIFLKQDFSCTAVLKLAEDMINDISECKKSNEDWLEIFYQYCLSKSFPNASYMKIDDNTAKAAIVYLKLLRIVSEEQKKSKDNTFMSRYPLSFLTDEEQNQLEDPIEYYRFVKSFKAAYIYELMKLAAEHLGYNTIDHVCGVHYLAINIGRQLKELGEPIDLGRVSGAAASHDIGKFGCKENELKRVPLLHYYYTDQWLKNQGLTYIRHIAVNHSTWDLELENLPIESLLLIYSDFRVKNMDYSDNPRMHIYNLDESYHVILNKLQNVDEKKLRRYKRVYEKLKDFENYLIHLGISTDPDRPIARKTEKKKKLSYSLLQGNEVIENIKYLSIKHNINMMHRLRDEASLNSILEEARSKKDWQSLRVYLRIFETYSIYLTQRQKLITLKFLYDNLVHPEDDIRKHSAELIGQLIATFDEPYRKEIPKDEAIEKPEITAMDLLEKYLTLFLEPDHKVIPLHQTWIGYSLYRMVKSLFTHCRKEQQDSFINILLSLYETCDLQNTEKVMYKLEAAKQMPSTTGSNEKISLVCDYAISCLYAANEAVRLSSAELCHIILSQWNAEGFSHRLWEHLSQNYNPSPIPSENYIMDKICKVVGCDSNISTFQTDEEIIADLFLNNLKTATEWIIKKINIDILLEHALVNPGKSDLHTALHFCNILKVSYWEIVRNKAGEALIKLMPQLSPEQRNEVAIELLRALEIDGYKYAEYIPQYLGRIILTLKPVELDELIQDLSDKIKLSSSQLNTLLLRTIGIAIVNYESYIEEYMEDENTYSERLVKLVGIILNGIGHYENTIKQIAFKVLGNEIFGSMDYSLYSKYEIFKIAGKKILTMLPDTSSDELLFLTCSAGIQCIYKFISEYIYNYGHIEIPEPNKIAFFPGTFDPFSLSHKEIARTIRDMGFEVYLAVDEFSWSKQTLPHLLRSNIINMSIADERDIYLYPDEHPINLSNPEDLAFLRKSFKGTEVYIVIGSDVINNASAYKREKSGNSIHSFPHIIFQRRLFNQNEDKVTLKNKIKNIQGDVVLLSLSPQFEDISSTQIRSNIDENRDISMLIDPLVQKYIYENGFYQRQPADKHLLQTLSVDIQIVNYINDDIVSKLYPLLPKNSPETINEIIKLSNKVNINVLLLSDINKPDRYLGFALFHETDVSNLYRDFGDKGMTQYIRENSVGPIVVIVALAAVKEDKFKNINQILLTETLSHCISKGYEYCVYRSIIKEEFQDSIHDTLRLQGFIPVPTSTGNDNAYCVNMSTPCVLSLDLETVIKEPFRYNKAFQRALKKARSRLQQALTELYKGHLVLSIDRNMVHERLIRKICKENNVPIEPQNNRIFGPCVCVPFGQILNKHMIPNTVTKSMHTEKFFNPDMKSYRIDAFPYYLDLKSQVRMIQSFRRPVILVDDLLHKGYRIKALDPILKEENVTIQKIIVGILSARGKEIMDSQNRDVDCAYYIPKLRLWFNENAMYPFIGGDALWRGHYPKRNLLPSVNYILPYAAPSFIKGTSKEAIYNLSQISIENSLEILSVLEKEYQDMYERKLTLYSMGHVFASPRCPDQGEDMEYDLNLSPSHYLRNDLELLRRLKNFLE